VFVDSLPGCLAESGELAAAFAEGGLTPDDVTELGAVIDDPTLGRRSDDELTFYKSVGHAVQDVAIARLVLDRAAALQLGEEIELGRRLPSNDPATGSSSKRSTRIPRANPCA
jgi:ornithine cyclodeaminase/alanine dehydrogenase-like protein (mu-crystallin family)